MQRTTLGTRGELRMAERILIKCCYKCTDRVVGCHSTCEKYISEKAEHDKMKAEQRKAVEMERFLDGLAIEKYDEVKKKWRKEGCSRKR